VATYPLEDFKAVVEGRLEDERLVDIYRHWDTRPREKGPVHGLVVRFLVGEYPLTILDAEAEMPVVPDERCAEADQSVKKLIGMTITSGYSERVRNLIGGTAGCTHLTHLAVAMGPPALHGFWTLFAQHPRPAPKSLEELEGLSVLLNSCHLWTKDGPFIQKIKDRIEKGQAEDP